MKRLILIVFACTAVVVAGCGDDDSSNDSAGSTDSAAAGAPESSDDASSRGKPKVAVPSGAPPKQLEVTDLIEGEGAEAKSGDEVTVQYVGVGYKSGEEFDSSWSSGRPFPLTLGAGSVIPGWEEGIQGMKVGGQRELVIPPELAYGETGYPPSIAPNETLVFVIDLLEVN